MIIDSSAVIATLLGEPSQKALRERLAEAEWVGIGAPTMVESAMVLSSRLGPAGKSLLTRFVTEAGIEIVDFTDTHWSIAADAFLRYGKGRHPAALNFGDCLTYAAAKYADVPLLCMGDDFPRTDLKLALTVG